MCCLCHANYDTNDDYQKKMMAIAEEPLATKETLAFKGHVLALSLLLGKDTLLDNEIQRTERSNQVFLLEAQSKLLVFGQRVIQKKECFSRC